MNDYVLNKKPEPASNDMVWAFDLGKGSIGEAVRRGNEFLHKASLLIPAEFAETKTADGGRRRRRTRKKHPRARSKKLNGKNQFMTEPNPPIPPIEAAPLPAYKDRSTGLVIFGILTLLLGCLSGL